MARKKSEPVAEAVESAPVAETVEPIVAEVAEPVAEAVESAPVAETRYFMAKGKAITSKRGIIAESQEVFAKDFPAGRLDVLVERGTVLKV